MDWKTVIRFKFYSLCHVFVAAAVIICLTLLQPVFKIFLNFGYKKLVSQINLRVGFTLF